VKFEFAKSDWPISITIRVKDGADAMAERAVSLAKEELVKAGFAAPLAGDSKSDAATSTGER